MSFLKIKALNKPGLYCDGQGLFLQVGQTGTKSWSFRYTFNGKVRQMGLGSVTLWETLKEVRDLALAARQSVFNGIDPLAAREAKRAEAVATVTFKQAAEGFIKAKEAGWRDPKTALALTAVLETYAYPVIGDLPVSSIATGHIIKILEPIWTTVNVTASRLRGRIEAILDWAAVRGFREKGANPAMWRGHMESLLAAPSQVSKTKHHPAMPYLDLPAFMERLRAKDCISARALEFTILTAARSNEIRQFVDSEIDLATGLWTLSAERMKSDRPHRVPLCARALEIIKTTPRIKGSPFIFPGARRTSGLSSSAMLEYLRDMDGCETLTVHGMRSSFRDWAGDMTNFPREVIEMALAHKVKSETEAAYRRSDALEKRRRLMDDWSTYCAAPPMASSANVIPIRATQ
ncbi:integrase arm-type DNA-binding domain-containing protein [Bradyrhizobium sp. LjRoot220]|uniref:tyrosine-type recombinase/integrase n=1 Tax=Bradyrhizobium sp. LjRoot220 TaxID=3342284 RepID=UPI003ECD9FF1